MGSLGSAKVVPGVLGSWGRSAGKRWVSSAARGEANATSLLRWPCPPHAHTHTLAFPGSPDTSQASSLQSALLLLFCWERFLQKHTHTPLHFILASSQAEPRPPGPLNPSRSHPITILRLSRPIPWMQVSPPAIVLLTGLFSSLLFDFVTRMQAP